LARGSVRARSVPCRVKICRRTIVYGVNQSTQTEAWSGKHNQQWPVVVTF
jgi:hypothetical protein